MSGFGKRLRRRALVQAARAQRAETAGSGALRRPVGSWVLSTKIDLMMGVALGSADTSPTSETTDADVDVDAGR